MKRRKAATRRKTRQGSSEVSALIRRLESEIARDEKARADATARIFSNRKLLEAANLVGEHLPDNAAARKARKPKGQTPAAEKAEAKSAARTNGGGLAELAEELKTPLPAKLPRGGGSVGIVLAVLQGHPEGLAAPELKRKAAGHSEAPVSLKEHGQYIYSILDTLRTRGQAEKGADGKWRATKVAAGANTTH